ncbi:lysyl-tRNA synthetase [Annulohypoxylon maeteangense]|uniref:lysyl-tRNA synthetase n=1 Tax=Annulohypoxylon maeteangense TaxID=1927788 RepID=UPI002008ABA3|nr:lysyl-tRNA synthetase [Annulohypoxylon maeteangense]KAI0882127.1 lysyl-tRNA synthetase [Annulohypoxylon maeteangense]
MEHGQYLRFLRPYLFQLPSSKATVYARLFSAGRYHPVKVRNSQCLGFQSTSRRVLHASTAKRFTSSDSKPSVENTVALSSRQVTIDKRVQKLKEYDALHYPRLGPRPNRMSIPSFRDKYRDAKTVSSTEEVVLEGRVLSVRRSGSKLVFFNIMGEQRQVQVMVSLSQLSDPALEPRHFKDALHPFLRGDIVSVKGVATRTEAGELTLQATELPTILSPGVAPLPEMLVDQETMVLNRHVDYLVNDRAVDTLRVRSRILKCMRDFFYERDFIEVQTPILADHAGGAIARPFVTSATELPRKELALRIAPELWLKRLVVGGNDKVFEIGPAFRNEGIDTGHNPEFTMCEFYSAYSNLSDLISMTEGLMTRVFNDPYDAMFPGLRSLEQTRIKLPTESWKQVEFIPALEEILGIKFPDLSDPNSLPTLIKLAEEVAKITPGPTPTMAKILDELASKYLEKDSAESPLFIIHHPACMSPLSKSFTCPKTGQLVSARAELFIRGREIANMYEEENDPFEQRRKFQLQVESKNGNLAADNEIDESYVQALEYGLPPTGGWGCGIDRLVMLLSGAPRIGDVLSFGTLKNVVSIRQAAKDS